MKNAIKIIMAQLGFIIADIISYFIFDIRISVIFIAHLTLTMGYLYGFWQSKLR